MVLLRAYLRVAIYFFQSFSRFVCYVRGKLFCLACETCFHSLHFIVDYYGAFGNNFFYYFVYIFFP